MTSIEGHVWGLSSAQDRVWAQVSGLRPSKAAKRVFMVMQAYIDESIDKDGTFVLAGYIASAEAWADFSGEWEKLLPYAVLNERGEYHFKMSEMALNAERMGRVPAFFKIIEKHVIGFVSVKINESDLRRAMARIQIPNCLIDWEKFGNSYYIAFRYLLDMFHINRPQMIEAIPASSKIDFYFDNRMEKKAILAMWDNYLSARPEEIKDYYGATPRFENDNEFLPLQAADFWAWWVRKWYAEGTPQKLKDCDFDGFHFSGIRKYLHVDIVANEDAIVKNLTTILRNEVGPDVIILDSASS